MSKLLLDIDKVRRNPHTRIVLNLPLDTSKTPVAGSDIVRTGKELTSVISFMTQDFGFGGGNEFNSPFESAGLKSLNEKLNMGIIGAKKVAGAIGLGELVKDVGFIQLQERSMTTLMWLGPSRPTFTLPLVFVTARANDDVRTAVRILLRTVYPTVSKGAGKTERVKPPMGYSPVTGSGTVTLQIGTWLRIRKLVVRNANFTFSKEVVKIGENLTAPLYAVGTMELSPYIQPSIDDVDNYFRASGGTFSL